MSTIDLENVTKRFGDVTAVENVDLTIEDGELLVLVGPSGCGKTTLLRTITGLELPTEGTISVDGNDVTGIPARKRDIALVFQNFALFPHMSVEENMSFNLRMQGDLDAEEIDQRVADIAEMLDISELLDRDISELSGGQKQRVSLGRAIVTNPAAFMLDEPLANLDANLRDQMETEIVRLQKQLGITTVHVTHNQSEAMTMGDRIAVMNDGELQQLGPPEEVFYEPANLFVAKFIGSPNMNLFDATVDADGAHLLEESGPGLAVPIDLDRSDPIVLGCRPEHVLVDRDDRSGGGWATLEIAFTEFHGASKYLFFDVGEDTELIARVDSDEPFAAGETVSVGFDPEQVHAFDPATDERIDQSARTDRTRIAEGTRPSDD
ncbi:ABC transporter ATP-binding protein [Halorhabdus amylolytica]|uniref:ABC transporter ATP-binding protein n=1 Tax=Halorhabdus amylolytica TaxID=2559573 RepID=UPI0010AA75CF|nr:ABC transporter ATP-binding protein [Halorhabdus amylolytica]